MTERITPDLAHQILEEIGLPAEHSWDDEQRHAAAEYALDCIAELQRFREREPLVAELALDAYGCSFALADAGATESAAALKKLALAVRDFKVTP